MTNVIRTSFQGKDGYLNITKGILTLYGGSKPVKWDITKQETTELLREFMNTAYLNGKLPSKGLYHRTNKNSFIWGVEKTTLERWNLTKNTFETLKPNTDFTKAVLSAMVRANVGN